MTTETMREPRCRIRVNLVSTVKDGWRIGETTAEVEWSGTVADKTADDDLGTLLRLSYAEAVIECRRRNDSEAR